jgi:hypothetical protein
MTGRADHFNFVAAQGIRHEFDGSVRAIPATQGPEANPDLIAAASVKIDHGIGGPGGAGP